MPIHVEELSRAVGLAVLDQAAALMVLRLLEADPDLADAARDRQAVIVLTVPHSDWVHPVSTAFATEAMPAGGDDVARFPVMEPPSQQHVATGKHGLDALNVLASERQVLVVTPHLAWLSDELRQSATRTAAVPAPGAAILRLLAEQRTLTGATTGIKDAAAARLTGRDIAVAASRRHRSADAFLARLEQLASKEPAPSLREGAPGTLGDLHGMPEAVAWGLDLQRDLADFREGRLRWADIDKGALLSGPSGCGKGTFARALANTLGVPFIATSLAQWQAEGHLGDLQRAMRATFAQARAAAPCVLLIDEVDGLADRDGGSHGTNASYSRQVVNGVLEELDGSAARDGVIVLGACNNASVVDPALTRPGRLDRHIRIPLPDTAGLSGILRFHLGEDALHEDEFNRIALLGLGGTGADAERWARGARRRARRTGRPVTAEDLLAELLGDPNAVPHGIRSRIAAHEAGHAVVSLVENPGSVISLVLSSAQDARLGQALLASPQSLLLRADVARKLRVLLAGRAAEELLFGEPSAGAGGSRNSDLAAATALAVRSVTMMGLGRSNPLLWRGDADAGGLLADPALAEEVSGMLAAAHRDAGALLAANRALLVAIRDRLLAQGALTGDDVAEMVVEHEASLDACKDAPGNEQAAPFQESRSPPAASIPGP